MAATVYQRLSEEVQRHVDAELARILDRSSADGLAFLALISRSVSARDAGAVEDARRT